MQHKITKYKPFPAIDIANRTWPNKSIENPPIWCSVDLRDGNQALIDPMSLEEKLKLFHLLVNIGFKQIEIGFPSAAKVEYDFLRKLIDENLIPDDVTIQVLCQAREHLIKKTFDSIQGAKNVIFHIYNSTSVAQRKIVFQKEQSEITRLILEAMDIVIEEQKNFKENLTLQYSPESFTNTELEFAKDICNAVIEKYKPHTSNKIIINLPATVEVATPNIYADMMEWMGRELSHREDVVLSSHAHNDRGTAVAATELSLLAGSQRVEGTLLGNGERTGNVDILTMALNMYTQGVYPNLDFSDIDGIIEILEECTKIDTHVRHPYVGELVYTAFSGSHQDAIKKGMTHQQSKQDDFWEVPYLPIDPADLNRTYHDVIRINSQSGKGGAAFILDNSYGFILPKKMHPEFGRVIQHYSDTVGVEIKKEDILRLFEEKYFQPSQALIFTHLTILNSNHDEVTVKLEFTLQGKSISSEATGNGPIDAAKKALEQNFLHPFTIGDYAEHALGPKSDAEAISYVQIEDENYNCIYGVGRDTNTTKAAIKAMFCAVNLLFLESIKA